MTDAEVKRRADIIDGVVRTMMVTKQGTYDASGNPDFDKFDIRSAVAMAVSLYAEPNDELVDMMNKVVSR
jgi:hypothetical protein